MTPTPPLSGKLRPTSVRVLGEGERSHRVPDDSAFTSAGVRRVPLDDDPDAGDRDIDDDVDSAASVTVDRSAVRLANFVYECYPGSRPVAAPPVAPRCDFEALYALSNPPESSHPRFVLYPRVSDFLVDISDRAASLARRSKPLSALLPKKVRKYAVADAQHFSTAQPLNPDFAYLCGNKFVSSKRWGSVTFAEMQRLKGVSQASLEAC